MNYNRAAMKAEVKQAMRWTRPNPMLVTLLFLVIVGAGASLISWLINTLFSGNSASMNNLVMGIMIAGPDYLEEILYYAPQLFFQLMLQLMVISAATSILTAAWNGLMDVGYNGYCLDMVRGMSPPLERVFGGFSRAGSVIPAYILVSVFTFLWSTLFAVGLGVLMGIAFVLGANDFLPILGVLLMFAAPVLYAAAVIWVVCRYAMVPYAIIDSRHPLSAMDAIRASKAIMKGRTSSFFVLQLSFIGWYLLEVVGVVIAFFFVAGSIVPYLNGFAPGLNSFGYMPGLDGLDAVRLIGPVLIIILLCGAAIFILNLWLTPYRTGCNARFYVYATGGQPIQPGPYGGQPGPYNSGPYGSTAPGQSSFSGYTQAEQPPQYGVGSYSQWNAPRNPQAPAAAAAPEPPAVPEAPAAPEAPAVPGAFAPVKPAETSDGPFEEPYAEPETPDDDTPQLPNGPIYPQY